MASSPQQFPSGFYDRCRNVAHIGITPSQPCNVRGFVLHEGFDGNPAPFAKGEYMFTPAIHETAALCGVSGVRSCLRFPCQLAQMLRLHSGLQETGRVMAHFGGCATGFARRLGTARHHGHGVPLNEAVNDVGRAHLTPVGTQQVAQLQQLLVVASVRRTHFDGRDRLVLDKDRHIDNAIAQRKLDHASFTRRYDTERPF